MDFHSRQTRLQDELRRLRLDALLVTHMPNIRYLCGFTGSSGVLLVRRDRATFFTDGRYIAQSRAEVRAARIVIAKKPVLETCARSLRSGGLGIEADHITLSARSALAGLLPKRVRLRAVGPVIERHRMIKEPAELALLRSAVLLGASLFDVALRRIRPGVSESAVAADMEHAARTAGADGMSFDTIVASGLRAALPHGRASAAPLPRNGFCILDFGVILAGYCSDMTRTVHLGRPNRQARAMYQAVLEAQEAGRSAARPGALAGDVDRAARRVLQKAGFARYFTHSTGHGVGLEIHEPPRLGRGQQEPLQPGMVVTVEPGIYIPGVGGVRIEDMVAITATGSEVLTPTGRELVIL